MIALSCRVIEAITNPGAEAALIWLATTTSADATTPSQAGATATIRPQRRSQKKSVLPTAR